MAKENTPQQRKPKRLSRLEPPSSREPSPQKVPERVPDWLRMLLGKYGEAQGNLIGLQEEEFEPQAGVAPARTRPAPIIDDSEESAELSALLEQMAEEGPPKTAADRAATSVEWGASPAQEGGPDSIDDMLSELGGPSAQEEAYSDDVPDWISESTAPVPHDVPPQETETAEQDDFSDIPDWLSDAPVSPADQPQPPKSEQPAIIDDSDIPDWLTDAQEPPVPAAEEQEFDLPDWLTTVAPPVAGEVEQPAEPTASEADKVEDITDWQVPDWITDGEATTDSDETLIGSPFSDLPETEAEIPDWLEAETGLMEGQEAVTEEPSGDQPEISEESPGGEPAVPDETEESGLPDWLSNLGAVPAEETDDIVEEQELPAESLLEPDWMADIDDTAAEEQPAAAQAPKPLAEIETDDWLAELRATMPEDVSEETGQPPAAEEPEESDVTIPDWLADASELSVDKTDVAAEEQIEMPDWLTEPPEVSEVPLVPKQVEGFVGEEAEVPAEGATEQLEEMPDWLAEEAEELETPDWPDSSAAALAEESVESDEDIEMPAWLGEAAPKAEEVAEPPELATDEAGEVPDLPEADEETAELDEDIEMPAWLDEAAPEAEEVVEPPELATDETEEAPDWLADLPEADEETAELDEDIEMPAWLGEAAPEAEEVVEPPELATDEAGEVPDLPEADEETAELDEDIEMPAWLGEAEAAPEAEEVVEPPELAVDEAEETPDWLADLPQAPDTGPLSAERQESVDEGPDWLADLRETAIDEAEEEADQPEQVAGVEEAPDWLADLPEADEEMPDWLADLPDTDTETAELDEDLEMPAWFSETSSDAEEEADQPELIAEGEEEAPDWLADLPEAEQVEPLQEQDDEPADWLAGLRATATDKTDQPEVMADDEEAPDWLADLPDTDEETGESDEEIEMPDWLAGLRTATDQSPAWSGDQADEDETADESAPPDWLSDEYTAEIPPAVYQEEDQEIPDWLADLPQSDEISAEETAAADDVTPPWLIDLPGSTPQTSPPETEDLPPDDEPAWQPDIREPSEPDSGDEDEMPDWLADLARPDQSIQDEPAEELDLDWLKESVAADEAGIAETAEEDDELVIPNWLGNASLDDLETPDWLLEEVDDTELFAPTKPDLEAGTTAPDRTEHPPGDEQTKPPDKTDEGDASSKKTEGGSLHEELPAAVAGDSPVQTTPNKKIAPDALATGRQTATRKTRRWLDTVQPAGADDDKKTTESTGMLTGISTLLPSEKVAIPSTETGESVDELARAAQQFYEIATQPPQLAALPKPISLQEKIVGRAARSILYLVFIGLVALPLLLSWHNEDGGPITEPARAFSSVLDSQRRQLISEQLGIIDLQQPGSVALVSFDYNTGTQGEMQPLAEAVLGRLKGQGMRIIAISLEPEGAPIAQQTLETLLAEKEEPYGEQLINLGYLPGQIAAVRQLATGATNLINRPDYVEKTALAKRAQWQDIKNISQVNVVVTLADNPATARWWVEQMQLALPPSADRRYLLAATSAAAEPFLSPYRHSEQLDGLVAGINGAAAIEAGRKNVGPARQMIDSLSVAHLFIVILIALGTIVGWMPADLFSSAAATDAEKSTPEKEHNR